MARGLNKVMLIGRIQPHDPELRYTQSGQAVCTMKLVTDESYKDKEGNMVERSEWHNVVLWGKTGEIVAQYMKKGRQIYIEGRLQSRKYEDKEGQTRYITEINASDFCFLDGGGKDANGGGGEYDQTQRSATNQSQGAQASPVATDIVDDDLPF